jgi:ATP-dependent protease Clp ATPase subunit
MVCSFCGRPQTDARPVICGPTPAVAICRGCVALCEEMFDEQDAAEQATQ